jgi:mono/diheme cytochrome c family protein
MKTSIHTTRRLPDMGTDKKLLAAVVAFVFLLIAVVVVDFASAGSKVNFGDDEADSQKGAKTPKAKPAKEKAEPAPQVDIVATGDRAAGEKIYKLNCASCHGFSGAADGVAASKFNPRPGNHRNAEVMDGLDDFMLFKVIREGGKALGRDSAMPAFGQGLNDLDVWDLIAYMRTLHTRIDAFIPGGAYFITKVYRVMSAERIAKAVGEALKPEEEELKIFTVFKFPGHSGYAEFVPYEPGKVEKLKKNLKLGYIAFVKVQGPDGLVEVGMAMDPASKILKLMPTDVSSGRESIKTFAKFEGQGKRGKYELWKVQGVTPELSKAVYKQFLRMLEAVFMYEKEEKDRTWMDEE